MTMGDFQTAVTDAVTQDLLRRAAFIESECATAMTLQDFDKLERLGVVEHPGCPPAVASSLWLHGRTPVALL